MNEEILHKVRTIAENVLSAEKMELVDIQYRREGRGWVLRLFIDQERGITLADCARISQDIGRALDVEDVINHPYTLEVSSPGLTRPLKTGKDFLKVLNQRIKVKTFQPIDKRRNFKGILLGFSDDQIEMEIDGGILRIPLSVIARANLEYD